MVTLFSASQQLGVNLELMSLSEGTSSAGFPVKKSEGVMWSCSISTGLEDIPKLV